MVIMLMFTIIMKFMMSMIEIFKISGSRGCEYDDDTLFGLVEVDRRFRNMYYPRHQDGE